MILIECDYNVLGGLDGGLAAAAVVGGARPAHGRALRTNLVVIVIVQS